MSSPVYCYRRTIVRGLAVASKVLVAAGATAIRTCQNAVNEFEVSSCVPEENPLSSPQFEEHLKSIEKVGMPINANFLGSAHQMGTCRMACDASDGVCKPTGETFEGLFRTYFHTISQ